TTFTASPSGLADYQFTIDGGSPIDNKTNNQLTTKVAQGATHTATVTVTDSNGCSNTSPQITVQVNAALTVSGATTSGPDCTGKVTLTATPSGGISPYTFQWFDGSTQIGTSNPLTVTLALGVTHSITVKTTDSSSNACTAISAAINVPVNQTVSVSLDS